MVETNAHNFIHMEKHTDAYNNSSSSDCIMLEAGWKTNLPAQKSLQMWFLFSSYDSHLSMLRQIQMQHVRCCIDSMLLHIFHSMSLEFESIIRISA